MTRGPPTIVILKKENRNLQKWANMHKSRKFSENWFYQEQRPVEIFSSIDKESDVACL